MKAQMHRAQQFRSAMLGIEAVAIASDRSFPRHAHDQFGIGVLGSGAHRSWSGIGPVEAVAGEVITVNPGEMHDGSPVRGGMRAWCMLYFDPDVVTRLLSEDLRTDVEIVRPALHDPPLAHRFTRLFASIIEEVPDLLAVEEDAVRTLARLFTRYGSRPSAVKDPPPSVSKALLRLREAPEVAVTLSELATSSGVSRFQLVRGFAKAVGTTPHAYLLQQRVRRAQRLLAKGGRPADVAAEVGFADQSHLTRAFSRQLGVTPARYRAALA